MNNVNAITDALIEATPELRRGLVNRRTTVEQENPTGDTQLAADRWVDQLLFEKLSELDAVGAFGSEEREETVDTGDGFSVAIDPLDGSSNLRANNLIGTIVGVYDAQLPARGRDLVGSMYVLYGPLTTMTVATDDTVKVHSINEGKITATDEITIPEKPTICGFSGRTDEWSTEFKTYATELRTEYKLRYTGAMVADVEQTLRNGGMVAYPAVRSQPDGILRLQFEANPMAYIVETAGGSSSMGSGSILDVSPDQFHQRIPTYLGNVKLIDRLESTL